MAHYSDSSSRLAVAAPLGSAQRDAQRATTAELFEAEVEAAAAIERLRDALDAAFAAVPDGEDPSATQCIGFARLMRAALAPAPAPARREVRDDRSFDQYPTVAIRRTKRAFSISSTNAIA